MISRFQHQSKDFFPRFRISSALKAANAYKKKRIPVIEIFQYLFLLIFSNRSMYMSLITGKNASFFAKDTVYRFMRMLRHNHVFGREQQRTQEVEAPTLLVKTKNRSRMLEQSEIIFIESRANKVEIYTIKK